MERQEETGYRYGPLERRGWIFGVRAAQFALAMVGMAGAVLLINLSRSWWGAFAAAAWVLVCVNGHGVLPVGGRLRSRSADSRNPGGRTVVLV
jgi:hypothetical protein